MSGSRYRSIAVVVAAAVYLLVGAAAHAGEVQVLRGAHPSVTSVPAGLPDVVVLRGAEVGGAIPPPRAPTPPPAREPAPVAPVVNVVIVQPAPVTAPVAVWPVRSWRAEPRAPRAVWRHPARRGR
jgi:hypothetical protein